MLLIKYAFSLTRSSWLNCALRDDEAVYWVSIGHSEAVAVGNWWYWVSGGHLCLYILHKEDIWSGVTDAWLTDSQTEDSATQLLIKYKSGALVTQLSQSWWNSPLPCSKCRCLPQRQSCMLKPKGRLLLGELMLLKRSISSLETFASCWIWGNN